MRPGVDLGVGLVVGGDRRREVAVGLHGQGRRADLGPVLAEVLGQVQAVDRAVGVGHQGVEPALVELVQQSIGGRPVGQQADLGQGDPARARPAGDGVGAHGEGDREHALSADQRVADAAGQGVEDVALVGAAVDEVARERRVDGLEVAGGVGDRVDRPAERVQRHVGGLAGLQQGPGLAGGDALVKAAVGPAHGGVEDQLAVGARLGVDQDPERVGADEDVVAAGRGDRRDAAGEVRPGGVVEVVGAVQQRPGRAAVGRQQEADAEGRQPRGARGDPLPAAAPTPVSLGLPVPTRTTDWFGSLLRG